MLLNLIFIIVGIVLVLWGADRLTEGSVAVAERMNIPQIVIGLTVVAMGTSMPEFCVSLISALKGTPDLAVGNVVGSNIFNSLFIVGITAAIAPMAILRATVMKDIPFALVASVILLMMCLDGRIGRIDAAVLFSLFTIFMFMTLKSAKINKQELEEENKLAEKALKSVPKMSPAMSVVWILAGLACLIGGSTLFVEGASKLATSLGVSEAVVGLTIVAGGTSLPELATSIVSARKGSSGIAIGNVLGSNVFNILGILGVTGLICPMQLQGITDTDLSMLVISMIMIWFFSFTKYIIERWEGLILSATFIGYIAYLISHA
ncbi:MAG: calcium/sodium antiporter [Prevotella nigrescens]|uniref:calcium/sodium antiporter n=1 Tax=Prevotella nigrescens TaxID=28133 RepID=UPI000B4CA044|nr:calcium/sodium antiporter [Prevotella nigrescens]MBF1445115.1 calcium/sodium antiporter [Prevotella nigrescens]OWP29945.1 sodium:proton exchanger [Prevotella nigrescens]QUB51870.1 calcium/sodium antiporter [Prevotella nigrescens]